MSCEKYREDLIGVLESTATPDAAEAVRTHLDTCEACRAEMQQYRALRARLEASAAAAAQPALEDQVMARVPEPVLARRPQRASTAGSPDCSSAPGPGGLAWGRPASPRCSSSPRCCSSASHRRPGASSRASRRRGRSRPSTSVAPSAAPRAVELWARTGTDRPRSQRLLMRIAGGPIVWTEGNATHYYQPGSGVVYTDDALTAGFSPWPGPRLLEMAKAAGLRIVDTRWRFPNRRSVVVEFSLLSNRGPMSARRSSMSETKLLVGLQAVGQHGSPGRSRLRVGRHHLPPGPAG